MRFRATKCLYVCVCVMCLCVCVCVCDLLTRCATGDPSSQTAAVLTACSISGRFHHYHLNQLTRALKHVISREDMCGDVAEEVCYSF